MKSTTPAILFVFCSLLVLSASCGKTYNSAPPPADSYQPSAATLNKLFAELRPEPQSVSVKAGVDAVVKAANGTVMHFNPSSFKDAEGNVVTSGTVEVKIVEMYKAGDMIANRASTMANGKILKSGGQINVTATVNGKPVFANKFGVEFVQPAASTAPMSLFYGNTDNTYGVTTWTNGGDSSRAGTMANSTTMVDGVPHYIFESCTQFGWTNCDQFYNADSPLTSVSVIMPDKTFNPSNTQLYLILPETRSVMSNADARSAAIGGTDYDLAANTIKLISEMQENIVPTGMKYKFVVITNKDGRYFYSETSGTITRKMKSVSNMLPKTKDEVKTLLAAL